MDSSDLHFMQRALELAQKGVGLASPNPTVGCVIVGRGNLLGEGYHRYDRRDHAEIVALEEAGRRARGATVYVTLEPCNHTGRTGPCSAALVRAGVERVVAATEDPNPATRGAGLARLREAGIRVETGVLGREAEKLNEPFACWIRTRLPFVTLKSALTLDGRLSGPPTRPGNKRLWITGEESRAEVHAMRHRSDALLTGIGTILKDDPLLTDRSGLERRRRLLRVVLDSRLRISPHARIVRTADQDLLIFTGASLKSPRARRLEKAGVELRRIGRRRGRLDLRAALKELGRREILSVLLEAGPTLNESCLEAGLVHKLVLFYAPRLAGAAGVPFTFLPIRFRPHLEILSFRQFGADFAVEASLRGPYSG